MLHVTFRNLESTESIRSLANELMAKIQKNHGEPARCHLVVEDNIGSHAHSATRFCAHLDLSIAHENMSFSAESEHQDAATAVRKVFARVERQLSRREGRWQSARGQPAYITAR